jgi:hypothetical protein
MELDIEELNKQMSFFQNDYHQNQFTPSQTPPTNQSINFPQPLETPMPTTQIKRPTRTTGTHRNEINDKMAQMKLNQPMMTAPNQFQMPSPSLAQPTRNNSQYQNPATNQANAINQAINPAANQVNNISMANKQHLENLPNLLEQHYQRENNNPLSAYFQQNYSTLNGVNNSNQQHMQNSLTLEQFNMPRYNTHTGGQVFVNPSNLPTLTQSPIDSLSQEHQPGTGYRRMDEKRIDYRQNMNSKVGNFIFDNPNAARYNPQVVAYNPNGYARDTRMVIQDSSKDIYRQEANSRMAQYSPLARASHVPINIANMSVNDFYANMNIGTEGTMGNPHSQYQTVEEDARAVLNARIGAYSPLAKVSPLEKPQSWQDNNVNRANLLVAHEELPIISH